MKLSDFQATFLFIIQFTPQSNTNEPCCELLICFYLLKKDYSVQSFLQVYYENIRMKPVLVVEKVNKLGNK